MHDLPTGKIGPLWLRSFLKLGGKKRMLAVTDALRSRLESLYGPIQGGDVLIAPNGVDLEQYEGLPARQRHAGRLACRIGSPCPVRDIYMTGEAQSCSSPGAALSRSQFCLGRGRKEDVDTYRTRAEAEGLKNVRSPLY